MYSSSMMKAKNQTISSEIEAKEKLIVYVYEYLMHTGANKAAHTFLEEIRYEKAIQPADSPGFLVNWWCVFWDLYCAAPDKRTNQAEPSNEAKAFHDYNTQRTGLSPPCAQPSPHNHQMMHQQPPPPPSHQQHQPPYMPRYGGPPPHPGQMRGGPGSGRPNMQGPHGPGGPQGGPHQMSQQMDQFGQGPGGPPPPHAGGPPLGGPPPPNMMPNSMDGMGRSGPMGPGGSHRGPINAPRAQHPISPMNPNAYQTMRPNSMGGPPPPQGGPNGQPCGGGMPISMTPGGGPQRGGPNGGGGGGGSGGGGWQNSPNVNYNVNSQSPAGQAIYAPGPPVTGGGPGTPGIMPSPQGSGPYSPATTAPVRDTTPGSQDGGQGIYIMKNVPSGNPMGQPNFGPMSDMGSMMMSDNMMEPIKSSPANGPSTPRPEEYGIPNYDQENDQTASAEILKVKQNLQEEAKKLTFDKEQADHYDPY